jgi:hypothetical protein
MFGKGHPLFLFSKSLRCRYSLPKHPDSVILCCNALGQGCYKNFHKGPDFAEDTLDFVKCPPKLLKTIL